MKYNVPDLNRRSRNGMLTQDEINWVEQQVRHFPYFQIHQTVLAQQEYATPAGNPYIEKGLIHSTNRKALAALLIEDPDQDLFSPSPENNISIGLIGSKGLTGLTGLTESPESPEIPDSPESPEIPDFPESPEIPDSPESPEIPDFPESPEIPDSPESPEIPDFPESPEIPDFPESPEIPDSPEFPELSELMESDNSESIPDLPAESPTFISEVKPENQEEYQTEADQTVSIIPNIEEMKAPVLKVETQNIVRELSPAENKLENKIKFRIQLFDWRIPQIYQQIEQYKKKIVSAQNSNTSSSNELIQSIPVKTWDFPVLPTELNGSFEPDFPIIPEIHSEKNTEEQKQDAQITVKTESILESIPAISELTVKASEEIASESEREREILSDTAIFAETPNSNTDFEKTEIEPDLNKAHLTYQHNNLTIEVVMSLDDSKKYLKKPVADLLLKNLFPQKELKTSVQNPTFKNAKKPDRKKVLEIIDRFIETEPEMGMKPRFTEGKQEDISRRSAIDDGEIVSETLALIYLKQGNKTKAIRIYEKLMLKFPEKSSYFESLLKKI